MGFMKQALVAFRHTEHVELVVGRIGRPHGVRGDVTVEVRTDDPDERFAVGRALATDPAESGPLTVDRVHWHSGRLLVRFAGIDDRDAAEGLRGVLLVIDSADLPPSRDADEFYDHELIGLAAVTVDGMQIGVVTEVRHLGQDLLVISRVAAGDIGRSAGDPGGGEPDDEVMVPFVAALVPAVDVAVGRIVIDPPPGLL
jgi:16S rRNA processing protein RimM